MNLDSKGGIQHSNKNIRLHDRHKEYERRRRAIKKPNINFDENYDTSSSACPLKMQLLSNLTERD